MAIVIEATFAVSLNLCNTKRMARLCNFVRLIAHASLSYSTQDILVYLSSKQKKPKCLRSSDQLVGRDKLKMPTYQHMIFFAHNTSVCLGARVCGSRGICVRHMDA
jgi:hypothetical protein